MSTNNFATTYWRTKGIRSGAALIPRFKPQLTPLVIQRHPKLAQKIPAQDASHRSLVG